MAPDQRYCLNCGQRRGDPRLPFMDAVVLMNAVRQPQGPPPAPAAKKRDGISPNAALIAGVGVLLLALGIGVLIGRSGNHTVASTQQAPQIVKVGGGEEAAPKSSSSSGSTGGKNTNLKTKKQKEAALKKAEENPASNEILHSKVPQPPPTIQPGEKCNPKAAGCSKGGEFNGEFFGE